RQHTSKGRQGKVTTRKTYTHATMFFHDSNSAQDLQHKALQHVSNNHMPQHGVPSVVGCLKCNLEGASFADQGYTTIGDCISDENGVSSSNQHLRNP
ncbi:hypothetical protein A2U01_0051614, partial [Trifolium medium]|nr:hypothetical protein [Trifolium medium]